MHPYILYIIKVSIGISILSISYLLLLRNDAQLILKRIFLAGGLLLAWIFPLIILSKPGIAEEFTPTFFMDPGASGVSLPISPSEATGFTIPWALLPIAAYLAGILILIIRFIVSWRMTHQDHGNSVDGKEDLFYSKSDRIYTLFSKIFISKDLNNKTDLHSILIHERAHIRQMHFMDVLLSEITLILTWFNPFSWLISRMIKENHEHLADRAVLRQGVNPAHYKALLLNHAMGGQVFQLGHQFNHSITKKRFQMMKKIQTSKNGFFKYMLVAPAVLAFMLITTASAQEMSTVNGKVFLENKTTNATGAAVIISGTTQGTVVDKNGEFKLNVHGNPDLVISFVGYETKIVKALEAKKAPVLLKATSYTYEYTSAPKVVVGEKKDDTSIFIVKTKNGEGKTPVYVVDGEVVTEIKDIDPDIIERVEVIKEDGSPLIKKYKAKDGLIIITTKKELSELVESDDQEVFYVVEDMPQFPGGKSAMAEYIMKNLEYPKKALKKKITGEVYTQFTVNTQGKVQDVSVVRSADPLLDEAAKKVISEMPDWTPGKQRGKAVSTKIVVPVRFATEKE